MHSQKYKSWKEDKLFPLPNDILNIVKHKYWQIIYKERIINHLSSKWIEKRPYKIIYGICRKVHEGRVFLKGRGVGPLIVYKDNYYINGILLDSVTLKDWKQGTPERYCMSVPCRAFLNIIHPIKGNLFQKPSRKVRGELIEYYRKNEGEEIKYKTKEIHNIISI
jgi:hypothetical protein